MFQLFLHERADPFDNSIPFLNKVKVINSDIELYADAAGRESLELGTFLQGRLATRDVERYNTFQ